MTRIVLAASIGVFTVAALSSATAQSLEERILSAPDGKVRMSFAAREGVCGDGGRNIRVIRDEDVDWESDCDEGPVRVVFRINDGRVVDLNTYVGGRWRQGAQTTDLGDVAPQDAADALLSIAADSRHRDGEDAIFPATIARDVTVWPRLIDIARDRSLPKDTRRQAVFWTGQEVARDAGRGLEELIGEEDEDVEIRKHAIFALSQREDDESVPALMRLVRDEEHPELRKSALFWLAQSDDPRVLDLFEELLSGV